MINRLGKAIFWFTLAVSTLIIGVLASFSFTDPTFTWNSLAAGYGIIIAVFTSLIGWLIKFVLTS